MMFCKGQSANAPAIIADRTLHVIDFKYGQGLLVEAENNPQRMLYALDPLSVYECLYEIDEATMTIYQPCRESISTWTISVENLKTWAENELVPKAKLAFEGKGEYRPSPWCVFCKAAVKCRTRSEEKLALARYEFAQPPLLTDAKIKEILGKLDDPSRWTDEIKAYAQDAVLNHGKQRHGYKVVEGCSVRKYSNEDAVSEAAHAAGYHEIFRKTLLPITKMEKLMGKQGGPRSLAV